MPGGGGYRLLRSDRAPVRRRRPAGPRVAAGWPARADASRGTHRASAGLSGRALPRATVGLQVPHLHHPAIPGGEPPSPCGAKAVVRAVAGSGGGTSLGQIWPWCVSEYILGKYFEPLSGLNCSDGLHQQLALILRKGLRAEVNLNLTRHAIPQWLPHESMHRGQYGIERHGSLNAAFGSPAHKWRHLIWRGSGSRRSGAPVTGRPPWRPSRCLAGVWPRTPKSRAITPIPPNRPGTPMASSPTTRPGRAAFAVFLRDRRGLSLEDVNTRYGTAWKSWDEVQLPRPNCRRTARPCLSRPGAISAPSSNRAFARASSTCA